MENHLSDMPERSTLLHSPKCPVIIALIAAAVLFFVPASADIVFPAENLSIRITGMNEYPEYSILAFPMGSGWDVRIVPANGDLLLGYGDAPGLYAVRGTDYPSPDLGTRDSRKAFFADTSRAIPATGFRRFFFESPQRDTGVAGVRETYRIAALNATCLALERTGRVFIYHNGSETEVGSGDPVHNVFPPWMQGGTATTPAGSPQAVTPAVTPGGSGPATPPRNGATGTPATAPSVVPVIGSLCLLMVLLMRRS